MASEQTPSAMPNSEEKEIQLGKAAGWQDSGAGGEEVGQHPGDHSRGVEHLNPEKWRRKKYMGECRAASARVGRMISELPSRVTK